MKGFKILVPTGAMGYSKLGTASLEAGIKEKPDLIGVDASSPDCGPVYVGENLHYGNMDTYRYDLEQVILAGVNNKIPVVIHGAFGFGTNKQMDRKIEMIKDIAKQHKLKFKLGVVYSDVSKEYLLENINKIKPLSFPRDLTKEDILNSREITAAAGIEPVMKAFDENPDVLLVGRSLDDGVIAALPIKKGYDAALAWHICKVIECSSACCEPESISESIMGVIKDDCYEIYPVGPDCHGKMRTVNIEAVANHWMYEQSSAYYHYVPGGYVDSTNVKFEQVNETTVRVSGCEFIEQPYTERLEGVAFVGYRSMGIVGIRCPRLITQMDLFLSDGEEYLRDSFKGKEYQVFFHVFGKNAVMKHLEPLKDAVPHEVGLMAEVIADNQALANEICSSFYHYMLFHPVPNWLSRAGNFAHTNSVEIYDTEPVYRFSLDHLLHLENPLEIHPIKYFDIEG